MEEKKFDKNTIIGYVLIFGILLWMLYNNKPTPEEIEAKAKQEQVEAAKEQVLEETTKIVNTAEDFAVETPNDSLKIQALKSKLGAFAYSSVASANAPETIEVQTELLDLKFSKKGGHLTHVRLKQFVDYDSLPVYIVKENNASFNVNFGTTDSRILNTKDLYFNPTVTKSGENTVVSMKLQVSETKFLEYLYSIKPNDYMMDFTIKSQGLNDVINASQEVNLQWDQKVYRHAKSIQYENRYTDLHYEYDDGKDSYLNQTDDEETIEKVGWLGYKQHFFTSILLPDAPFSKATITSKNLVKDETIDTVFTKFYTAKIPLTLNGGELNTSMKMYYGPTDYKILKNYDRNLDEIVPLGWGIFGWINRYLFIPLFGFLGSFMPYGIAIVVMTILIKLLLSFVQYKQFLSQAKMKILKPELEAIRDKYKDNKMKAQQETMALQSRAGASPLSGCLPGLMQIPVFYALFQFFPSAIDLRQKGFLWAKDLSSYDSIYDFPAGFSIPLYGDHISLFPILAAVAIFFYMRMTTGQQTMAQPTQEGMPDMSKMMKYMIYFSPLMMLFFFNNYASGLSLYYFISNLISIGIMLVIKNYIIDEDKVLAKIEAKKAKPKKENRFQKKMKEMMEQAEQQKRTQEKNRKK